MFDNLVLGSTTSTQKTKESSLRSPIRPKEEDDVWEGNSVVPDVLPVRWISRTCLQEAGKLTTLAGAVCVPRLSGTFSLRQRGSGGKHGRQGD